MKRGGWRLLRGAFAALAIACFARDAAAQGVSVPELKAAFLFNFAKFTGWPAEVVSLNSPLVLCVTGDGAVADALEKMVHGHQIDGHSVVIARGKVEGLPTCHVLYAAGLDGKQTLRLLDSMKGLAVLTVSDREQFTQSGGVASLFVDNGKMRFAINQDAAERAHLTLSSRLLSLAKLVKDERNGSHD
jgi:hypothetical protein